MSHCVECQAEMPTAEARQYLECYDCRRMLHRCTPIRDLNKPGTEDVGRKPLDKPHRQLLPGNEETE